jgi:hypothetical protein
MLQRHSSTHVHFSGRARGFVMALLALVCLAAPAFAVRPYTDPRYKLQKAPLERGMSMQKDSKRNFRFKQDANHSISRGGVVPGYHRPQWSWPKPRRLGGRV